MGNSATTVSKQIALLRSRGLNLDLPEEKTAEILLDIGYYRLGFYWNPFEIDTNHHFQENVNFSDVVSLYYLDVDLRNILLRYLNRIEINFRTKLIYTVSNHYGNIPTWFAHPSVVEQWFISSLDTFYDERFKKNNSSIKKHHRKYINDKYAPAWKTLEFFSFGTILTLFKALKDDEIKESIANFYGIRKVDKLTNHIETILLIRNICAHGGLLFDLNTPKGISFIPELQFNNNDRHSLDAAIKLIAFYIGKISKTRQTEFSELIAKTFNDEKLSAKVKAIIATKIGYKFV